jgi:polyhydroxybutyrate depolymerase
VRRLAIVLFVVCLSACQKKTVRTTIVLGALQRSYDITVGRTHDPKRAAPVLFALHPYGTEPGVIDDALELEPEAVVRRGFILVTPRGRFDSTGNPFWNATRACCDHDRRGGDDIGYLRAVLADVRKHYSLDPQRVFAVGVSNGGFMAQRWACEPGGALSGIISISGVGPEQADPECQPSRPVSVVQIHGDRDEVILYQGGILRGRAYPSAPASVEQWARLDRCAAPVRTEWRDFGLDVSEEARNCDGARVTLWRVRGGPHNLPLGAEAFTRALERIDDGHATSRASRN